MGGSWLAYTSFVCVAVITVGLLWFRAIRPMLEDFGVLQPDDGVRGYAEDDPRNYVTHDKASTADTPTDPGLSAGLSGLSADVPPQLEALMVDRSRAVLIAALVAAGWKVGEIRTQLKGDTGAIGEEIKAERKRQGLDVEEGRIVPVNGGKGGYIRV
jgi:hypothetical protein